MKLSCFFLVLLATFSDAFNVAETNGKTSSRRDIVHGLVGLVGANILSSTLPAPALASGGATAGKYT